MKQVKLQSPPTDVVGINEMNQDKAYLFIEGELGMFYIITRESSGQFVAVGLDKVSSRYGTPGNSLKELAASLMRTDDNDIYEFDNMEDLIKYAWELF